MSNHRLVRRRFLQGAAVAAAATAVPAQEKPLRFGTIGVGKRGSAHLTRLVARSDVTV